MINIGQRLQEERIRRGLSLETVSQSTKIKIHFLEAIEKGEYNKLPSSTFAHGFVRNYVHFLGLSEIETMAIFKREFDEERIFKVLPRGMSSNEFPLSRKNRSNLFLILTLFLVLLVFLFFQYKDAIISPSVSISTPKENEIVASTSVEVAGKTNPENVVFVNSFPVSVDDNGNFKKSISVFPGENEIDIKVVSRFNKSTETKRHIEVKSQ